MPRLMRLVSSEMKLCWITFTWLPAWMSEVVLVSAPVASSATPSTTTPFSAPTVSLKLLMMSFMVPSAEELERL